ncbi:hypothetical protein BC835DRAFT_1307952 [Cytidiella melzeri]|nr:hypothetical protein BC835DRAFT_1307952 [Cytidiella melzeri]
MQARYHVQYSAGIARIHTKKLVLLWLHQSLRLLQAQSLTMILPSVDVLGLLTKYTATAVTYHVSLVTAHPPWVKAGRSGGVKLREYLFDDGLPVSIGNFMVPCLSSVVESRIPNSRLLQCPDEIILLVFRQIHYLHNAVCLALADGKLFRIGLPTLPVDSNVPEDVWSETSSGARCYSAPLLSALMFLQQPYSNV